MRPEGLGLALGAGGARGIAHVVLLEALDELGIKPVAITGTSIGAIIGAAYAAGHTGRALRSHLLRVFSRRHHAMAKLLEARVGRFTELFRRGLSNPVLIDAEATLTGFWPGGMPDLFEGLLIPFAAVATDFYGRAELLIDSGPLLSGVAGSMAIPGLVRPVTRGRADAGRRGCRQSPALRQATSLCHHGRGLRCRGRTGVGRRRRPKSLRRHVRIGPDHADRHHGQDAAEPCSRPFAAAGRIGFQSPRFLQRRQDPAGRR